MHAEALKTLTKLRAIERLEAFVTGARDALAYCPGDRLLGEFIRINEALIQKELKRLTIDLSARRPRIKAA
ncbi:MAG: hypothetical protein ABI411_04830 [Tahibacter sp.]